MASISRSLALATALALGLALPAAAGEVRVDQGLDDLARALIGGEAWLDARYRHEHVDQQGLPRDAGADTLRLRYGYRSGDYLGFHLLVEAEHVAHLGGEFNDTVNGKAGRPVVADPEAHEVNQAYLAFAGLPKTTVKFGRQRLVLDNARFIGDVGFRQNQQTFDALSVVNTTFADFSATYAYLFEAQRIFGDDHPLGSLDTESHLVNLSYGGFEGIELTAYAYLLEIPALPARSTQSYGLRFTGVWPLAEDLSLRLEAEAARQFDHADNPADYDVGYWAGEASLGYRGLGASLGIEVLDGNGAQAFQTPFATLHKFQGWADKFLATPATGIRDLKAGLSYVVPGPGWLGGLRLAARYHRFLADAGGGTHGEEFDLLVSKRLFERVTLAVKFADYSADDFATDTRKIWFTVGVKF